MTTRQLDAASVIPSDIMEILDSNDFKVKVFENSGFQFVELVGQSLSGLTFEHQLDVKHLNDLETWTKALEGLYYDFDSNRWATMYGDEVSFTRAQLLADIEDYKKTCIGQAIHMLGGTPKEPVTFDHNTTLIPYGDLSKEEKDILYEDEDFDKVLGLLQEGKGWDYYVGLGSNKNILEAFCKAGYGLDILVARSVFENDLSDLLKGVDDHLNVHEMSLYDWKKQGSWKLDGIYPPLSAGSFNEKIKQALGTMRSPLHRSYAVALGCAGSWLDNDHSHTVQIELQKYREDHPEVGAMKAQKDTYLTDLKVDQELVLYGTALSHSNPDIEASFEMNLYEAFDQGIDDCLELDSDDFDVDEVYDAIKAVLHHDFENAMRGAMRSLQDICYEYMAKSDLQTTKDLSPDMDRVRAAKHCLSTDGVKHEQHSHDLQDQMKR